MKHLKSFEGLEMLRDWKLLLSDEDFTKSAAEFEEVVDCFLEITDLGYQLNFITAYGREVRMSYQDYLDQNETYQEFIHGIQATFRHGFRGRYGPEFKSEIITKWNYDGLILIQNQFKSVISKLKNLGFDFVEYKATSSKQFNSMSITYEFIKN